MITIIGGDFTRSWLSLPLSHGIKVKGKKKTTIFGVPHSQKISGNKCPMVLAKQTQSPAVITVLWPKRQLVAGLVTCGRVTCPSPSMVDRASKMGDAEHFGEIPPNENPQNL